MPALFTSPARVVSPSALAASSAPRFTAAASVTSNKSGVKRAPNSAFSRWASASLRTLPNTWKALLVSTFTQPQPMPVEAPVTTALLIECSFLAKRSRQSPSPIVILCQLVRDDAAVENPEFLLGRGTQPPCLAATRDTRLLAHANTGMAGGRRNGDALDCVRLLNSGVGGREEAFAFAAIFGKAPHAATVIALLVGDDDEPRVRAEHPIKML